MRISFRLKHRILALQQYGPTQSPTITSPFFGTQYRQTRCLVRRYGSSIQDDINKPGPVDQFSSTHKCVDESLSVEDGHSIGETEETSVSFDTYLAGQAERLMSEEASSVPQLYAQYLERSGRTCKYVVPYEEQPLQARRADVRIIGKDEAGDGLVMVVYVLFMPDGKLDKVSACSGFIVDAQPRSSGDDRGKIVVTCAHTLEEMRRKAQRAMQVEQRSSMAFIVTSNGQTRRIKRILSAIPRCDVVAVQLESLPNETEPNLRSLPLCPFPVYSGQKTLTHLFGAPDVPDVVTSVSRLPASSQAHPTKRVIEEPIKWLGGQAWRRWGAGNMLGYRSYTNMEVEAGIHSSLPHILTSILPTSGSSGGPIVNAETGAVVGMISGRRMDNRVEGERGWGASSESIFEMFSLPGFIPTGAS